MFVAWIPRAGDPCYSWLRLCRAVLSGAAFGRSQSRFIPSRVETLRYSTAGCLLQLQTKDAVMPGVDHID